MAGAAVLTPSTATAPAAGRDRAWSPRREAPPRCGLAALRPTAATARIVALALAGFILVNPLELAIVLLLVLATLAAARRLRQALPYLKVALYVGLFLALLNPLFSGAGLDVLWEAHLPLLHVRLTLQGIYFGLGTALRLAVVVSAFALWSVAVDPDDQLALLTRFSFRSGLVVSLATRLFPVLSRDGQRIADAQRCRAVELDRGGRRERAARRIPLLSALLTQSLERAVDVAAAMEARWRR